MTTDTRRRLGPADVGTPLTHEEYEAADYAPGFDYELVAGRLYVTPAPNAPHMLIVEFLSDHLKDYARARRDVLQLVTTHARVITRALGGTTDVEPDISAFRRLPDPVVANWRDMHPLLVAEVISESDPRKDLVRNREVYWLVPSIQEYWIVDPRDDPARPTLLALARGGDTWTERPTPAGGAYRTDLLPGLAVDLAALLARGP